MRMGWQVELDELRHREALAKQMGGADKVKRQHDGGRLTVRERIDKLLDPGSFHETGAIAGMAEYDAQGRLIGFVPANSVTGRGKIDGRIVMVAGDDFTVRGGSADATIPQKTQTAERTAQEYRVPMIRIIEGSGGGGSVKTIETRGRANLPAGVGQAESFVHMTGTMAVVPVVALGLGSVAGMGAGRMVASHYSVMTKESAMFVAGPPVVAHVGQTLSKKELGGWEIQTKCGAVDHAAEDEEDAFNCARRFLSYMPSSIYDLPPVVQTDDDPNRRDESLLGAIPRERRRVYKMRDIVNTVVDRDSFFEVGKMYGRPIITGLARLNGQPVALMASDPYYYAGSWTADACQKVVRFVDMAESFHLPIVYLQDCPGFMVGLEAERTATIRLGARALAAINQTTVPWCTIIIRNSFGVAGGVHGPANRQFFRYAWPSARWGSLPLEGGIEAAYRADIEASPDPKAKLLEIEARLDLLRSPFRTAEAFWIEEIIDPRDTRRLLCEFVEMAVPALVTGAPTKFRVRP